MEKYFTAVYGGPPGEVPLSSKTIPDIEEELKKEAKKIKRALNKIRKVRADKGQKRLSYKSNTCKVYNEYLKRANAKGFEFELTDEMCRSLPMGACIYCGSIPSGFDRKDSDIGYTLENSAPCCNRCNMMKHRMSVESFIKQVNKIFLHMKQN